MNGHHVIDRRFEATAGQQTLFGVAPLSRWKGEVECFCGRVDTGEGDTPEAAMHAAGEARRTGHVTPLLAAVRTVA